jgi:hypothetical protein
MSKIALGNSDILSENLYPQQTPARYVCVFSILNCDLTINAQNIPHDRTFKK